MSSVRKCRGLAVAVSVLAACLSPQPVAAQGTLHLATTPWSPFTDRPGNVRFAEELVEEALRRAGIDANITVLAEGQLTPALQRREFDGSPAMWRDEERERTLLFSSPYLDNRLILVGRESVDVSAASLDVLAGRRVALVQGYSYGDLARRDGPVFVASHTPEESLQLLLSGQVDYALMDQLVVLYLLQHYPAETRAHLAIGTNAVVVRPLYFAVRRDLPGAADIVSRFNGVLASMVLDHSYHQLLRQQWIEADVDGDGLLEMVPDSDALGPDAPTTVYPIAAAARPTPLPASRRRYYLDGEIYTGWSNVPLRYKVTRQAEATANEAGVPVFNFNWYVSETAERIAIDPATLPFAVSFIDSPLPVRSIDVSGVTLYETRALLTFAIAQARQPSGAVTARSAALAMRTVYHEDGYFLANVTASVAPGSDILQLKASEGHIGAIRIEGLRDKVSSQVAKYMRHVSGERPLKQAEFERALMLSSDLSGVDMLSQFSAPDDSRAATLRLIGHEYRQTGSVSFDTVPVAPGTAYRSYVLQQFNSTMVGGDLLRVMGFGTLEPENKASAIGTVYYRAPVGSRGTYVQGRAGNAFVHDEYRDINLSSNLYGINAGAALGHPLRRRLNDYLYAVGEYEFLESRAAFGTPGIPESHSHAGRLSLIFGHTAVNGALTQISARISGGKGPIEDEMGTGEPAGFAQLRVSFGALLPVPFLGRRTVQHIEVFAQPLATRLPLTEHLFLGYGPYLRGYPPVELSGERGLIGTAELSHTIVEPRSGRYEVVPSMFIDFGYATSRQQVAPYDRRSLGVASAGGAVKLKVPWAVAAGVWVAVPLADGPLTSAGDVKAGVQMTKGW